MYEMKRENICTKQNSRFNKTSFVTLVLQNGILYNKYIFNFITTSAFNFKQYPVHSRVGRGT